MEAVFLGTEIKFAVEVTCEGFDMETDDFTCLIMKGHNVVKEYPKSALIVEGDSYILCIDTNDIGTGNFDLAVNAQVPDGHFPDSYRTEIERVSLMTIKKL